MFELEISVNFEAAHCLPKYPGKCQRLHGHNWKVEVAISGDELDEIGMLMDFRVFKQEVNSVIECLDHYYLNEIEPFNLINPTAENISKYIYKELLKKPCFSYKVQLKSVKVWESANAVAIYKEI